MAFRTTRWSLIQSASGPEAGQALAQICADYWQPVYAFYRRSGVGLDEAADLTQGLFADLLARASLQNLRPERGPFRAFLCGCARNWLANQRNRDAAHKRGGGRRLVSLQELQAEEPRLLTAPAGDAAAAFERRWAEHVIDRASALLAERERTAGREQLFAVLLDTLDGSVPRRPWAESAAGMDTTEGALKVAAHRLKVRFRECLREVVRDTIGDDGDALDECRELLLAFFTRLP